MALENLPKVFTTINDGGLRLSTNIAAPKVTLMGVTNNREKDTDGNFVVRVNEPLIPSRQSQVDRFFTNANSRPSELKMGFEEIGSGGGTNIELVAISRTVAHLAKDVEATDLELPVSHVFTDALTSTALTPPTGPVQRAAVASVGTLVYLAGGLDADGSRVATVWKYDTVADTWTDVGVLPHDGGLGAFDVMAAVVGNRVYFFGGTINGSTAYSAGPNVAYVDGVLDPDTIVPLPDAWDLAGDPGPVAAGAAYSDGTNLYVAGGYKAGTAAVAANAVTNDTGALHSTNDYFKFTNVYGKTVVVWINKDGTGTLAGIKAVVTADVYVEASITAAALAPAVQDIIQAAINAAPASGVQATEGTTTTKTTLTAAVQGKLSDLTVTEVGAFTLPSNFADGTNPDQDAVLYWPNPLSNTDPGSLVFGFQSTGASLASPVSFPAGATVGTDGYIFGGKNTSDPALGLVVSDQVARIVLNGASTTVSPLDSLSVPRWGASAVVIRDALRSESDLLLLGGIGSDGKVLSTTIRFDPDGAVKYLAGPGSLDAAAAFSAVALVNDLIYLFGGTKSVKSSAAGIATGFEDDLGHDIESGSSYAVRFRVRETMTVRKLRLNLAKTGAPAGSLVAQIRGDTGTGLPSAVWLTNANSTAISIQGLTAGPKLVEFSLQSNVTLTAGTDYWLVLVPTYTTYTINTHEVLWGSEHRALEYRSAIATHDGASWTANPLPGTFNFEVVPVSDATLQSKKYNFGLGGLGDAGFGTTFPFHIQVEKEIMQVTGYSTTREVSSDVDVFLVDRGQWNTTAAVHARQTDVYQDPATLFDQLQETYFQLQNHPTDTMVVTHRATADNPFLEVGENFAHQLANFCYQKTQNDDTTIGVIGVEPSFSGITDIPTLAQMESWVAALEAYDATNYLGDAIWTIADGVTDTGGDGIPDNYAFWATTDEALPTGSPPARAFTVVKDRKGNPVDIGAYISVVALEGVVAGTGAREKFPTIRQYNANGSLIYAGMIVSLPVQSGTTNKVLPGLLQPRRILSGPQANRLVGARYVTALNKPKGYVAAKDVTFAHNISTDFRSDFVLLTTVRISHAAVDVVRTAGEPFIGNSNSGGNRAALQTEIEQSLTRMRSAGAIQDFDFTISTSPDQQVLGESDVDLVVVPAFELLRINLNFSLARQ